MDGFVFSASQRIKRQERKLGLFKVKVREKADSYEGEIGLESTFLQGKLGFCLVEYLCQERVNFS